MTSLKKTIAVSGDEGSFSEEAAMQYAQREGVDADFLYAIDMEGVLAAVEEGRCDIGILPVFNSTAGLVTQAFESMGRHRFIFNSNFTLDVQQCLLLYPETPVELVSRIVSHPQALAQCMQYVAVEFPGVPTKEWEDTAKAARDLSAGVLQSTDAVIAPARCAELYGLRIFKRGIQDLHPNLTTFISVRK